MFSILEKTYIENVFFFLQKEARQDYAIAGPKDMKSTYQNQFL